MSTHRRTNFGPYEDEALASVPRLRRWLRTVVQALVLVALVVLASIFLFPLPAHAGRSCEARPPTLAGIARSMDLAQHTAQALDASGARVVLLARAGPVVRLKI